MKATERQRKSFEELINQAQESEKFLVCRKPEESRVPWLQYLNILDSDQGLSSSKKLDSGGFHSKGIKQEETHKSLYLEPGKGSSSMEKVDSSMKGGNMFEGGLGGDNYYPSLKLPQAIALAKEFTGWPLMSNKMQMQKCERCSQEFCSPLNQRRHMRATHRKPLHGDKEDLKKKRDQIEAFWDKLSSEEACEILLANNLALMDLSGASVVKALTTQLQQPSLLLLLPQSYTKVATTLLDIVQSRLGKVTLKSEELFGILDDASENNVLCGVASSSMQRCIFEGEPGKVGLEMKNLVASLGFLIEYRLVRAWMDDKDAEALRCQKALVEEEEAAQKKRAKLQERKRQRKLRIKEIKDKERQSIIDPLSRLEESKFSINAGEGREGCLMAIRSSASSSCHAGPDTNLKISGAPDFGDDNCKSPRFSEECGDLESGFGGHFGDGIAHDFELRLDFSNQEGEEEAARSGRRAAQTMASGGGGFGWKEQSQSDVAQSYGQVYGKERDGVSRSSRTPYYSSLGGSSASGLSTPRYGHYREKVSPFWRPSAVPGAVWTRKTPLPADSKMEGQSTGPLGEVDDDATKFTGGLSSQVSSVSMDSVASHSSGSISARVGAEEQVSMVMVDAHVPAVPAQGGSSSSRALVIGSFTIPLVEGVSHVTSCEVPRETGLASSTAAEEQIKADPWSHSGSETQRGMLGTEEGTMQFNKSHGLSLQNKPGPIIKVWRPVTPGGGGDTNTPGGGAAATDCSTICDFSHIANFLHQRWADAVSSPDVTSYSEDAQV